MDLKKAYDSVDRRFTIKLLEKYKMGPRLLKYIKTIWKDQKFVLKQGGVFSDTVEVERGVTQGRDLFTVTGDIQSAFHPVSILQL